MMLKQLVHIILAFWMLLASMGFTVGKHYCMGELKGVSVFMQAENCDQNEHRYCHHTEENDGVMNGCCSNEVEYIKGIDLETSTVFHIDLLPEFDFTPIVLFVLAELDPIAETKYPTFCGFHPPPVIKDIPVFVQAFLL